MEHDHFRRLSIGAALRNLATGVLTGRLSRRLKIGVVSILLVVIAAGGLLAYRQASRPVVLTAAAGSTDGDVVELMSAISRRLARTNAPVRLRVVDRRTSIDAARTFANGKVDLVVGRGDIGDLSGSETVVVVSYSAVLLMTPPNSTIASVEDLGGRRIGVVGGSINHRVVTALSNAYELERGGTEFAPITADEIPYVLKTGQVDALLFVEPISDKFVTFLRSLFPNTRLKPKVLPIESARAIASVTRIFETYELPKGAVRGSPPVPEDDVPTLRVPYFLLARKGLNDDTVTTLTKAIMEMRRELIGEIPSLSQIGEPSEDSYISLHPGAAAYFNDEVKSFFDRYGDPIFYTLLFLGSLMSVFAALWQYVMREPARDEEPLALLQALDPEVEAAASLTDLRKIEGRIDAILGTALDAFVNDPRGVAEANALQLAVARLERLIARRRANLEDEASARPS